MKTIIITGLLLIATISIASAQGKCTESVTSLDGDKGTKKLNCTHIGKLTICTKN